MSRSAKTFYTISEAALMVGKGDNRKLIRALIRKHGIVAHTVGRRVILDEGGIRSLRAVVKKWDARPRLSTTTGTRAS